MTSRSRKKPPITALKLHPTEAHQTRTLSRLSLLGVPGRCMVAGWLLAIGLTVPLDAQTKAPAWSPAHPKPTARPAVQPKKPLAATRVSTHRTPQAERQLLNSNLAARASHSADTGTWNAASLPDTSPHLNWQNPHAEHRDAVARPNETPSISGPLQAPSIPPLQELPRMASPHPRLVGNTQQVPSGSASLIQRRSISKIWSCLFRKRLAVPTWCPTHSATIRLIRKPRRRTTSSRNRLHSH